MFYSWILPIGVQGAKDNTVVCVYAWEACTSKIIEQDKVNYAVSEREDRVTDVLDCNWAAPSSNRL